MALRWKQLSKQRAHVHIYIYLHYVHTPAHAYAYVCAGYFVRAGYLVFVCLVLFAVSLSLALLHEAW